MMRTLAARPFPLLGALVAGSVVTLAVMVAAGSDPAVWVAVAGAAACACGLVVGSTARVLPAATLASVAAAALVLAVDGGGAAAPVEVRAYKMQALVENAASRVVDDVRLEPGGAVRHLLVTVDRTPCGTTTERRYEMLWYLDRSGRTFTARDLVGVQLAGVDPALACG